MKLLEHDQGSDEWFAARLGIPTASCFKDIINSKGKAAGFDKYANTLVAERLMGKAPESFQSEWMARGNELEPQARAFYEFERDVEVNEVGLCLLDDGSAGASPDGLTDTYGLEIKCPAPHTHVAYLSRGKLPAEYVAQVQGCMWICERDEWDFLSFHPDMPPMLLRVQRDDIFISKLADLVKQLNEKVETTLEKIRSVAA